MPPISYLYPKLEPMKRTLFIACATLFFASCSAPSEQENTDILDTTAVEATSELEMYGEAIDIEGAVPAEELLTLMEGQDSIEVKVRTTVQEVCQVKGCWMDVNLGNDQVMSVSFKDYGFFVPKDCAGREVVMEGVLKYTLQSVEWLRHKAEDAGQTEDEIVSITEPVESYQFVASGVILQ